MGCSGRREKGIGVGVAVVQVVSSQRNAFFAGAFLFAICYLLCHFKLEHGSYGPWKTWKNMKFQHFEIQVRKTNKLNWNKK